MDVSGSARPRQVKSVVATARLLGVLPQAPPLTDSGSFSSSASDELTEDDVFWIDEPDSHRNNETDGIKQFDSSSSSTLLQNHRKVSAFGPAEKFGILAALPDHENRSIFNRRASIPSADRLIPKPAQDRLIYRFSSSFSTVSTVKYHQSAPVNVPVMPKGMIQTRQREFDDDVGDEEDGDDMMMPPHEIVARTMQRSQSQMAAYSVLEGAGRTLKGRDLRQVRNAIWRRTGFLD